LQGSLIDLQNRENITEGKISKAKKAMLDSLPESEMIVFSPKNPKHTITVFTDVECGYCRKLHQEIASFMQEGIKVRYLLFPRAGLNSSSYEQSVSIWCAADRNQALTDAKAGKNIPHSNCDNPVKNHMDIGEMMGVNGTPTIVLEDGKVLPGYVPAARMATYLNGK
ncbi:thiol:disulfide interchange protein DsbC, partial [Achromatium sp. WMS2]